MVTLRVNVALDFVRQPVKNNLISDPTLALSIAGVKQYLTEAKTFRWTTSVNRMMSGYVTFDAGQLQSVLQRSGNGAVFFQRLASNQVAPPEVDWLAWDKSESHQDYLKRALSLAEKAGSFLAFRRGGGACIRSDYSEVTSQGQTLEPLWCGSKGWASHCFFASQGLGVGSQV